MVFSVLFIQICTKLDYQKTPLQTPPFRISEVRLYLGSIEREKFLSAVLQKIKLIKIILNFELPKNDE